MLQALFLTFAILFLDIDKSRSYNSSHQDNQSSVTTDGENSTTVFSSVNERPGPSAVWPSSPDDELRRYNQLYFIVTGIYMTPVAIVGMFGNVLSIVILAKGVLKSSSVVYLFIIALLDLIYQIFSFPWKFTAFSSITSTLSWKTFYSFYISYAFPVANIAYTASVWMVVVFTIERFVMVVYPLKKHLVHEGQAKRMVGAVIIIAALVNAPRYLERVPSLAVDPNTNETYYDVKTTDLSRSLLFSSTMFWSSFLLNIGLPFLLLGVFNTLIVYHIRRASEKALNLVSNVADQSNDARQSRDAQITRLLFGIVIAFFLCNSVGAVMNVVVGIYGKSLYFKIWFRTGILFGNALLSTNPTINFIVYTTCSGAMRKAIAEMLGCSRLQKVETRSASDVKQQTAASCKRKASDEQHH